MLETIPIVCPVPVPSLTVKKKRTKHQIIQRRNKSFVNKKITGIKFLINCVGKLTGNFKRFWRSYG